MTKMHNDADRVVGLSAVKKSAIFPIFCLCLDFSVENSGRRQNHYNKGLERFPRALESQGKLSCFLVWRNRQHWFSSTSSADKYHLVNNTGKGLRPLVLCSKMEVPDNVPSLIDIKRILPRHCFQPMLSKSFYYVFKDLIIVAALYGAYISVQDQWLKLLSLPLYWYLQGTMFWAIFVLGHDCGHGSFSNHTVLNDLVGFFLHR